MRWILVIAIAVAACGPTGPRWVGEDIHAVDGYWVDTERPCLPVDCATELREAVRALPAADAEQIVGAALAGYPNGYVDSSCKTILMTTGGLWQPHIIVFDLADGRRRVVMLACMGPMTTGDGALVEPKKCMQQEFVNLRVGQQPGILQ